MAKKRKPMSTAAKRKASARMKKINNLATQEQKKSGTKKRVVKTYKLSRKAALKKAGKLYKKYN